MTGCNHGIAIPDGNDSLNTVTNFLGLQAGVRYMLYQSGNYYVVKDGTNNFYSNM